MSAATASIRELRTDFRSVKRKIEEFGRVTITDNGEPAYVMEPIPRKQRKPGPMPDYMARVLRHMPKAMTEEATRRLHEDNRGEC